ncbi:MAG TPA: GNAT family N-acetyltransferase, partial [Pyrinomonadaceae bacterium]|nr:GNAT family N-acetyltransferase [Pyrinomonadaceae bacterium]
IIETESLQLVPCRAAHVEAIRRDRGELERVLKVRVHEDWPVFPETIRYVAESLRADPSAYRWGFHLFLHAKDRVLIGEGGFKGRPDQDGVVEIGYAIVPTYRRRGLAFEAAKGLTDRAFSHEEVKVVQAHTLLDGTASIRILEKLGMKPAGTAHDPDEGEVLRWRVERQDYIL